MLANLSCCYCSPNPGTAAAPGYTVRCSHTDSFGRSLRNSAAGHSLDCCTTPHTAQHFTVHLEIKMAARLSLLPLHFSCLVAVWLIPLLTRAMQR